MWCRISRSPTWLMRLGAQCRRAPTTGIVFEWKAGEDMEEEQLTCHLTPSPPPSPQGNEVAGAKLAHVTFEHETSNSAPCARQGDV